MDSLRGRLLVATPAIVDGVFERSVVYVLDHDAPVPGHEHDHGDAIFGEGALGVILNRPLDAEVADVLPEWHGLVTAPGCLFEGGPVATDAALAVGVLREPRRGDPADHIPPVGWRQMTDRVGLIDLDELTNDTKLQAVRVFAGYAGWSPGQLEAEVAEGSWIVVDAELGDLASTRPETLWNDVLRRQSGDLRLWSTFPPDPHLN